MAVTLHQSDPDFEKRFSAFLATKREVSADVDAVVREIIAGVRAGGDAALADYTRKFDRADLDALMAQLPSTYVILSPYEGLPTPIVLSAWNAQLKLDSATDSRIPTFFEEYWRNQNVPEPGAACTGAIDGPGKRS